MTSETSVPLPLAILIFLLALRISGFALSSLVIDWMIALTFFISFSARDKSPKSFPTPGSIFNILARGPIFLTIWSIFKKSSKLNFWVLIFSSNDFASSSLMFSWAFSTRETTSPIPKILEASLSGWKSSRSSIFSPTPTNLIGFPTTDFIERAAPPLVSPSNFVRTTPSIFNLSLKFFAKFTASCPIIASTTRSISWGLTVFLIWLSSSIRASSTWSLPAVSIIIYV